MLIETSNKKSTFVWFNATNTLYMPVFLAGRQVSPKVKVIEVSSYGFGTDESPPVLSAVGEIVTILPASGKLP